MRQQRRQPQHGRRQRQRAGGVASRHDQKRKARVSRHPCTADRVTGGRPPRDATRPDVSPGDDDVTTRDDGGRFGIMRRPLLTRGGGELASRLTGFECSQKPV